MMPRPKQENKKLSQPNSLRILLAVPTQQWNHRETTRIIFQLLRTVPRQNEVEIHLPSHKCNENCYHWIVKKFLAGNYHVLFQMDADNPPTRPPWELLSEDLDIIGLPTPIWRLSKDKPPIMWNAFIRGQTEDPTIPDGIGYQSVIPPADGGLEEVDAIGGGALLIRRRVFENARMRSEGWHRMWRPDDGTAYRGLDLAFSQRAKEEGFHIWVAWDHPCNHFKEINLLEIEAGFKVWNKFRRRQGLLT